MRDLLWLCIPSPVFSQPVGWVLYAHVHDLQVVQSCGSDSRDFAAKKSSGVPVNTLHPIFTTK